MNNNEDQTEAIGEVWFLYSENEQPMGRLYRQADLPSPELGLHFQHGENGQELEIVEYSELGPTCMMRRFRIVVRVAG